MAFYFQQPLFVSPPTVSLHVYQQQQRQHHPTYALLSPPPTPTPILSTTYLQHPLFLSTHHVPTFTVTTPAHAVLTTTTPVVLARLS